MGKWRCEDESGHFRDARLENGAYLGKRMMLLIVDDEEDWREVLMSCGLCYSRRVREVALRRGRCGGGG